MMGYLGGADTAKGRSDQDLRDVRDTLHSQAVQWSPRGPNPFPAEAELLSGVREHQAGGHEGHASLASTEAQSGGMRVLRDDHRPARAPHRPQSNEQRPGQPRNPLLYVPLDVALGRGPGQEVGECGQGGGYGCSAWGQYASAIHRWEICLGRIAPSPTEVSPKGNRRLSPRAVEFMMGLPEGHVTDPAIGISRNAQLKALGNGVVPQQATAAVRLLLASITQERAA